VLLGDGRNDQSGMEADQSSAQGAEFRIATGDFNVLVLDLARIIRWSHKTVAYPRPDLIDNVASIGALASIGNDYL